MQSYGCCHPRNYYENCETSNPKHVGCFPEPPFITQVIQSDSKLAFYRHGLTHVGLLLLDERSEVRKQEHEVLFAHSEVLFPFNWEDKVLFEVSSPLLHPARSNPEASGLSRRFSNR